MELIEPFTIFCPNEPGMKTSEHEETGQAVHDFHAAINHWLQTGEDEEIVNDRLRSMGLEPSDYWELVDTNIDFIVDNQIILTDARILDSGLVIPR